MKMKKLKTIIIHLLILIVSLLVVRLLDFTLIWSLMQAPFENEILSGIHKGDGDIFVEKNGLSTYAISKEKLMAHVHNQKERIFIISYYDLFHPLVFLIFNKGKKIEHGMTGSFVDSIEPGLTEVFIFKTEHARVINKERKVEMILPVLGDMLAIPNSKHMGFVMGHGTRKNSGKVLLFYFYIPFLLIIFFSIKFDRFLLVSFFYYFEMTILFTFKGFFEKSHYFLNELSGMDSLGSYVGYFQLLVILILFSYGVYSKSGRRPHPKMHLHGQFRYPLGKKFVFFACFHRVLVKIRKKNTENQKATGIKRVIIIFFLLLPILLRF